MTPVNTAVLIIDDEQMVRDNIEEILIPQAATEDELNIDNAFNLLFDAPKPLIATRTPNIPVFTVNKASNGMEGVKLVREAVEGAGHTP
ncbi:hypothetical protein [Mucilaginibacter antarcticus]|uniref:hypothetical protein n=1 Tax=Mucilaginibacter antarcticus TaxID=1855725 RepID=UPI003629AB29